MDALPEMRPRIKSGHSHRLSTRHAVQGPAQPLAADLCPSRICSLDLEAAGGARVRCRQPGLAALPVKLVGARQCAHLLASHVRLQAHRAAVAICSAAYTDGAMLVHLLCSEAARPTKDAIGATEEHLQEQAHAPAQEVGIQAEGPLTSADYASEANAGDARDPVTVGQARDEDYVHAVPARRPLRPQPPPLGPGSQRLPWAERPHQLRGQRRGQRGRAGRRCAARLPGGAVAGSLEVPHDLHAEAKPHQVQPGADGGSALPRCGLQDCLRLPVEARPHLSRQCAGAFEAQLLHRQQPGVLEDAAQEHGVDHGEDLVRGLALL
mmetsp:Transcript_52828/g.146424  ORF Transcript_52828/g.146424 Transcript_52828/m.146424 type:complete len:323 (+) Transcript_52828:1-969(+)